MKKLLCGLLCAAMLTTTIPTEYCQAAEDFYSNVVIDYISDSFTTGEGGRFHCSFNIPQINWEGEEISRLNADILSKYETYYQMALQDPNAYGMECESVSYEWSVTDDILTLIIYAALYPDASGWTEPDVYSVDLFDAKVLSKGDIYSYFGYKGDSYVDDVRDALGRKFCELYASALENGYGGEFLQTQMSRTIADENVEIAIPYIDNHGELALKMRIYSIAAADYYPHLAVISELEDSPYYTPVTPAVEKCVEEEGADGGAAQEVSAESGQIDLKAYEGVFVNDEEALCYEVHINNANENTADVDVSWYNMRMATGSDIINVPFDGNETTFQFTESYNNSRCEATIILDQADSDHITLILSQNIDLGKNPRTVELTRYQSY